MYFPDRGCVRPLRHLYGYATGVTIYFALIGCRHCSELSRSYIYIHLYSQKLQLQKQEIKNKGRRKTHNVSKNSTELGVGLLPVGRFVHTGVREAVANCSLVQLSSVTCAVNEALAGSESERRRRGARRGALPVCPGRRSRASPAVQTIGRRRGRKTSTYVRVFRASPRTTPRLRPFSTRT